MCFKAFTSIISFNPYTIPMKSTSYYKPHFTGKESEEPRDVLVSYETHSMAFTLLFIL